MYEIDEQQIRSWWKVFKGEGRLVEIRLLGASTYSGYFKDVDTLITALRPYLDYNNERYYGSLQAYYTLNDIDEDLYGREQCDKFVKKPKATTTDGNVVRRRFVMLDFDACRVAGVSASDSEFEKAHLKAVEVYRYLISQGFKEPIITTSGNGWHAYLTCDMPNDDEHNELVKRFLQSLGKMFSDECVEIDEKVYNPARVDKMIGSWAKKGSDTKERKWRLAKIVKVPQDLSPNEDSLFQKIADLLPKEEPSQIPNRQTRPYSNTPFDLRAWLNKHSIVYKEESQGGGTKFTLEHCPWEDTHSSRQKWDSALFQNASGQITFSCFHSHCKDKTWFDFRNLYEPNAYNKPQYQSPYRQYAPTQGQKPKYEIKNEIPELGKKWLSLSSIKKVDIMSIERVNTGFTLLDNALVGLAMGEVTLLSGSNASGKSSWLNSLIINFIQQDVKCALWSGELPAPILKSWLQMVAAGKRFLRQSQYKSDKFYVPDSVGARIDRWTDGKLFIYNDEYGNTWEQIFHDMKELVKAGVKVFMLDNLMSLDINLLDGSQNEKQRELILQIKDFAKKEQVHIVLVAHPRKTTAFLRKNDISGTSDLTNAVDNVFIVHRVNSDFMRMGEEYFGKGSMAKYSSYGNVVEVCKNRMFGVVDLFVGMYYESESRRFKNEANEEIHYGWEELETQGSMPFDANEAPSTISENGESVDWYVNTPMSEAQQGVQDMPFATPLNNEAPF